MIDLEEAQTRLLALADPLVSEFKPLGEAFGRCAAQDITALRTQPARDLSAMDGYAIAYAGLPGPWRVIGESSAGKAYQGTIAHGETVRIFTGAPLATNTDTVIMQEEVTRSGDRISIDSALSFPVGHHVRKAGSDFTKGDIVIHAGDFLTPARIGLAAMAGFAELPTHRQPRIAILSTGNEIVEVGKTAASDQIPSSNGVMIMALLANLPCTVISQAILRDNLGEMTAALQSAAKQADIIVTIGGASVGDHDLVKPALEAAGGTIDFWKIAMRPGKPLIAGRLGDAVTLGLPGNPVSAFVTAILFLKPLVLRLAGARKPLPSKSTATLGSALPPNGARTDHIRATLHGDVATPIGINDSAALLNLSRANALIVRKPGADAAMAGQRVEIIKIT